MSAIVGLRRASVPWWIMTALCWGIALWSLLRYASFDPAQLHAHQRDVYLQHWLSFYAHALSSPVALLTGALQFHRGLRERWPRLHRACGIAYLTSVLVGGLAALDLATVAYGYVSTRAGFGLLGVFWLFTAAMALYHIRRREIAAHRRWAIRNFSLTFAAVTLRLWLPALMALPDATFDTAYAAVAWCSWLPNLAVAEWLLRRWGVITDRRWGSGGTAS